jgi:cell division septation protein DedD
MATIPSLYTRQDYVKPEERELYKEFCETMFLELAPKTLLEQSLAAEITGASWRLRRCSAAEAELADYALTDPLLDEDEATQKKIRSIERARASAHSLFHRSINQLRKLQSDRPIGFELSDAETVPNEPLVSDCDLEKVEAQQPAQPTPQPEPAETTELASNCKPAPQIARNAQCPCGSREKYKRCCGKDAPPVLNRAA